MSKLKRKKKSLRCVRKVIMLFMNLIPKYTTRGSAPSDSSLLLSVCGCLVSGLDAFQMVDLVDSHSQGRRHDEGEDTDNSDDGITIVCITEDYPSGDIQHVE